MKIRPAKLLRVAGKAITPFYIFISLFLIIGLQGYGGDATNLFYLHAASTGLAIITYPLLLYGFIRGCKPKVSLVFAILLIAAYPTTFFLLAPTAMSNAGPNIEFEFTFEMLSVPLTILAPALLYLLAWAASRREVENPG